MSAPQVQAAVQRVSGFVARYIRRSLPPEEYRNADNWTEQAQDIITDVLLWCLTEGVALPDLDKARDRALEEWQ